MRSRLFLVLALMSACGRVNFDPLGGDANDPDDGSMSSDGTGSPGTGDLCATAIVLQLGVLYAGDIANATDDYPQPACGGGVDVVFRVDVPSAGLYAVRIQAQFNGATTLDTGCPPPTGTCHTFGIGVVDTNNTNFGAGTNYIIVDRISGAGTTFTLTVQ